MSLTITQIKRKRKLLGLGQHALAKLSGVTYARISYAETGRIILKSEEIAALGSALEARTKKVFEEVAK